ncbi:MAG: hypothetical protein FWH18_12440 [Marinilabiliaceae bacterium]|nr:hypothetical protein [Marinilabiliaceae bacterium]
MKKYIIFAFYFVLLCFIMESLITTYRNRLEQTDNDFVRYLMPDINWNNRLFAIIGARGTGKTTFCFRIQ